MNICDRDLERAVTTFLKEAQIPLPAGWGRAKDVQFMYARIYPAMLKALEAIEPVNLCYGFDIDQIEARLAALRQIDQERTEE